MSSPLPTATGTLEATPLLNLAIYALDRQLTGTLVLEEQDTQRHAIYFLNGAATKVRTAAPIAFLGQVLVELGSITEEIRERTFAEAQEKAALHGSVLLASGAVDDFTLREALREQITRKILYLAGLPADTVYGYYEQIDFLERWGGTENVRGKPLSLVWRLIEEHARPAHIREVLDRLGDRPLRLHYEAPLLRFRFSRVEQSIVEVLRAKAQPLAELLSRDLAEKQRVERLVYALAITRQFDLGVPGVDPVGVDEAPSSSRIMINPPFAAPDTFGAPIVPHPSSIPAAPRRSPLPERPHVAAFKAEIRERARRTDETLYDVLGIPKDAQQETIQAAFLELAKKWHPDRIGPEYQDVRDLATRVFARMSEAQQVLGDPVQRKEYDKGLRKAGKEAQELEHVQKVLRAATAFQKAEVLLKRNNLAAAEIEAKQALADDPSQAEYLALVAWIDAQKPNCNVEALIKVLDRALGMQPNNLHAHWYRGQLYKRIGKDSRAIQDFRFIAERDPRHTDAVREIRLYQMRRSGPRAPSSFPPQPTGSQSQRPSPAPSGSDKPKSGEGSGGGLISKLFKR